MRGVCAVGTSERVDTKIISAGIVIVTVDGVDDGAKAASLITLLGLARSTEGARNYGVLARGGSKKDSTRISCARVAIVTVLWQTVTVSGSHIALLRAAKIGIVADLSYVITLRGG